MRIVFGIILACLALLTVSVEVGMGRPTKLDCNSSYSVEFFGEVTRDQTYYRKLSRNYAFGLTPLQHGWGVEIFYRSKDVLIPIPLHPDYYSGVPYFVEGWNFRNSDNTGPNAPGPKNINSEMGIRHLGFSPQCWSEMLHRSLCGSEGELASFFADKKHVTSCANFFVDKIELGNLHPHQKAYIRSMTFTVRLRYAPGFPP